MRIPSITANGSCVVAKIPRNFAIDAPMPPTSEGEASASWKLVTQYVNKSPKNAATNMHTRLFTFAF